MVWGIQVFLIIKHEVMHRLDGETSKAQEFVFEILEKLN
jgi:hypothetical protein